MSGGDVTSARLFVKISGRQEILGLVGYWDNVAWDEFEQQKGKATDAVLIDTMQNYLANKAFNRGGATHEASASMCFVGNTKHTVEYMLRKSHLFESIPAAFVKGAFLDRIHLFNPGWEISPLKKYSFSAGYGMITDYFAAVLHAMRKEDRSGEMSAVAKFSATLSERDHLAVRKTFSGMMKLLYPDGNCTPEEALEIVDFAAEGRKRVKEQLYRIDETFRAEPAVFEYDLPGTGETRRIETLEEAGVAEHRPVAVPAAQATGACASIDAPASGGGGIPAAMATAAPTLGPKHVEIKANQRGVSYDTLFGEYLAGARKIVVVDPFLFKPYQIDNLIDLVRLILAKASDSAETPEIRLRTKVNDAAPQEQEQALSELKEELAAEGIDFDYTYDATHDRGIFIDGKWAVNLGRGLDIYEYFPRFTLQRAEPRLRKCRDFHVSVVPINPS